jgi:hypothetical protein
MSNNDRIIQERRKSERKTIFAIFATEGFATRFGGLIPFWRQRSDFLFEETYDLGYTAPFVIISSPVCPLFQIQNGFLDYCSNLISRTKCLFKYFHII